MAGQLSRHELKHDIKEIFNFGITDSSWVNDYATIAEFLQEPSNLVLPLWELSSHMMRQLVGTSEDTAAPFVKVSEASKKRIEKAAAGVVNGQGDVLTGHSGQRAMKWNKCLSTALSELESIHGFNSTLNVRGAPTVDKEKSTLQIGQTPSRDVIKALQATRPEGNKVPVLTGVIKSGHFAHVLLGNGLHWKDPGVSPDHGEYTHRIQWWCIVKGGLKLHHTPLKLFTKLSDKTCFFQKKNEQGNPRSLWFWLLDAVDDTRAGSAERNNELIRPDQPCVDNARSPEWFNRWMISTDRARANFPLLSQYLADRYHKRSETTATDANGAPLKGISAVNYLLRQQQGTGAGASQISWKT